MELNYVFRVQLLLQLTNRDGRGITAQICFKSSIRVAEKSLKHFLGRSKQVEQVRSSAFFSL